jgi:hypothetical protein
MLYFDGCLVGVRSLARARHAVRSRNMRRCWRPCRGAEVLISLAPPFAYFVVAKRLSPERGRASEEFERQTDAR